MLGTEVDPEVDKLALKLNMCLPQDARSRAAPVTDINTEDKVDAITFTSRNEIPCKVKRRPQRRKFPLILSCLLFSCLLARAANKVTKVEFNLGRVTEVFPDTEGRVRDIIVIARSRRGKLEHKPRKFYEQKIPAQRLAVLVPVEEAGGLPPADEALHVCEETMRVPDQATVTSRDPRSAPGPTDSNLNVPNGPTDPRGAHSPNSDLNVPTVPQHSDSADSVVTEPVQLLVNVLQDGNGLCWQSGYRATDADDMDFITRLVNIVKSEQFHCSECQYRHNVLYNILYYETMFEEEN